MNRPLPLANDGTLVRLLPRWDRLQRTEVARSANLVTLQED
jgi:hypothetical protein